MDGLTAFRTRGEWYKAALHVHTTWSDGRLTPEEVAEVHREQGYRVLAVTDHDVITDAKALHDGALLTIPSVEVCYGSNAVGQSYHLVVLGVQQMVTLARDTPVQQAIREWQMVPGTAGEPLLFLAHPYWSGLTALELMALDGLQGLEIHNTSAHTDLGKGLATVHWDQVLVRGKRWWGYAVDDVHWMQRHGRYAEAFGGWVWIKAEALSEERVLEALRNGCFYASSGPRIHNVSLEDSCVDVRCSEVVTINFIGHSQWGSQHQAPPGATITEARHRLTGRERYLRVECVDGAGRAAWSNPVFLMQGHIGSVGP